MKQSLSLSLLAPPLRYEGHTGIPPAALGNPEGARARARDANLKGRGGGGGLSFTLTVRPRVYQAKPRLSQCSLARAMFDRSIANFLHGLYSNYLMPTEG